MNLYRCWTLCRRSCPFRWIELCFIVAIINIIICILCSKFILKKTSIEVFSIIILGPYCLSITIYYYGMSYIQNRVHSEQPDLATSEHNSDNETDNHTNNYIICINPCNTGVMGTLTSHV